MYTDAIFYIRSISHDNLSHCRCRPLKAGIEVGAFARCALEKEVLISIRMSWWIMTLCLHWIGDKGRQVMSEFLSDAFWSGLYYNYLCVWHLSQTAIHMEHTCRILAFAHGPQQIICISSKQGHHHMSVNDKGQLAIGSKVETQSNRKFL